MTVMGERIIASIRAHAAKNPKYIYQNVGGSCCYASNGKPSCIVGHALWDVGFKDSLELKINNYAPFRDIVFALDLELDSEEKLWITEVQNDQDLGCTWGESVINADKRSLARMCEVEL